MIKIIVSLAIRVRIEQAIITCLAGGTAGRILRHRPLAIIGIPALLVVIQIHRDEVRIAPRVAIDQIRANPRRTRVTRHLRIQENRLLRVFDMVVIHRLHPVAVGRYVHQNGDHFPIVCDSHGPQRVDAINVVTGAAAGEIVGHQCLIVGGDRKTAIDGVVLLDGADNLARASNGRSIAARMPMMAMTTSNSMMVKASRGPRAEGREPAERHTPDFPPSTLDSRLSTV